VSAIKDIHGSTSFANAAAGTFYQTIKPDADSRDFGVTVV